MATVEESLRWLLVNNAGVAALAGQRIYPVVLPQGAALPAIVYQRVSGARVGQHLVSSGLARPRFQFACMAESYSSARALATAVREALHCYQGTANGVEIDAILVDNEIDAYAEGEAEAADTYTVYVDTVVWHHE